MVKTYALNGETWIDIDSGSMEEIHSLMDKHSIHPFVAKELFSRTPKPRIEFHDRYIFCILHFPAWKHTHSENTNQEIDFIIAKDLLITARYDTVDALHKLSKELEVEEVLSKDGHKNNSLHIIFTRMLRGLYAGMFEELEYIEDMMENITSNIFKEKEREMVVSISEITRTLLDFKRVTDMHHEILKSLKNKGKEIFGNGFGNAVEDIISDYLKINSSIKSNLEMVKELRNTDNSLLSAKQNEKLKQWTVIGSILLILGIIATITTIFF